MMAGRPVGGVHMLWTAIKEYDADEDGHKVVLAFGKGQMPLHDVYGVLLQSPETFEVIAEYPDTEEGSASAKFAADVADRTLSAKLFLAPEEAN